MGISENLFALKERIAKAAVQAGRGAGAVRLMAVSKNMDVARITEALAAGQALFGENYVQEAKAKWEGLKAAYPAARLHLIGPLQTNKAEAAVALFDRIDSLDRPKLAHALADAMKKQERRVPVLIEVNIGGEVQKHGCLPAELPALLALTRELGLAVEGLMAIPPADKDPAPFFKQLAALAAAHGLREISMGMSGDYESAIACGSTLVRLGTAVFGPRH
jgi:pyridoxal phosphate enzyme (YggS family)